MSLIHKLLNVPHVQGNRFGIELEVEGVGHVLLNREYPLFLTEQDGSLRDGGAEYVLTKPATLTPAINAYKNIYNELANDPCVKNSGKAGIHLHLNVSDLTPVQVMTLYCILASVEPIMLGMYSDARRNNLFCLPIAYSDGLTDVILEGIDKWGLSRNMWRSMDRYRYSNINIASVFKNGTIELRGLESMASPEKVEAFLRMLDGAKKRSKQYQSPLDFINSLSENGSEGVCQTLFGDDYLPYYDHAECFATLRCVQEIAYRIEELPEEVKDGRDERKNRIEELLREFENERQLMHDEEDEEDEDEDDDF